MTSLLAACVIAWCIGCAYAVSVFTASITFTIDVAHVLLVFSEPIIQPFFFNTLAAFAIREGYYKAIALDTSTAVIHSSSIAFTLPSELLKTAPLPMFYTLTVASNASSYISPVDALPVASFNQESVRTSPTRPRYCQPPRAQSNRTFAIQTEADLAHLAAQRCTHIAGPAIVANLNLPQSHYIAGLGLIQFIEGSLLISNNTNLLLDHFASLKSVGAAIATTAEQHMIDIVSEYVPYGVTGTAVLAVRRA